MKLTLKPLAKACALVLVTGSVVAATPAATIISNQITTSYQDSSGQSYTSASNVIELRIREVRAVDLVGNSSQEVSSEVVDVETTHTLTNSGNISADYTLAATNNSDDTVDAVLKIYLANADGSKGAEVTGPISVAAGATAQFIVVSTLPAGLIDTDTLNVTLIATDGADANATASNVVALTFSVSEYMPDAIWSKEDGGNCHAYSWVKDQGAIGWPGANAAAEAMTYNGKTGHLVTVTSAEENDFIVNSVISGFTNSQSPYIGLRSTDGSTFSWVTGEIFDYNIFHDGYGADGSQGRTASDSPYAYYYPNTPASWHINAVAHEKISSFIVEFDTDCAVPDVPQVDVELTASKDVMCDGEADDAFGPVNLADMASGECAIMRGNAKNNGVADAKGTALSSVIPDDVDYNAETLASCLGESCVVAPLTDVDTDADGGQYSVDGSGKGSVSFQFGDLAPGAEGTLQYQVKIK